MRGEVRKGGERVETLEVGIRTMREEIRATLTQLALAGSRMDE